MKALWGGRHTWLAIAALALTAARPAAADEGGPVSRAAIDGDILSYYGGEGLSADLVMGYGVACVAAGIPLVIQSQDFGRGLGIPLLSLGALEGIGALFYAFQVRAEITHYRASLANDPQGFRKEELAHLTGTQGRFVYYRAIELGLTLVGIGVATYGFIATQHLAQGLGVGLFAIGLPFLLIDTVNNTRASNYANRLRRFDPSLAVARDEHGWRLALGGNF
jgi:hypothetical protein